MHCNQMAYIPVIGWGGVEKQTIYKYIPPDAMSSGDNYYENSRLKGIERGDKGNTIL